MRWTVVTASGQTIDVSVGNFTVAFLFSVAWTDSLPHKTSCPAVRFGALGLLAKIKLLPQRTGRTRNGHCFSGNLNESALRIKVYND